MSKLPKWPSDFRRGFVTLENEIAASERADARQARLTRIEIWCAQRSTEALYDWRDNPALAPAERKLRMMDWHDWNFAWRVVRALIEGRQLVVPYGGKQ